MTKSLQRWLGITGLIFVVLVVVSVFMVPSIPNSNASSAKLTAFYDSGHQAVLHIDGIVTVVAVVVGVFWFWYFRDWLIATNPTSRRLATVSFGGALLFAAGGALAAGIYTTLGDASNTHPAVTTLQSLNYIQADLNNGLTGAGVAIFLAALVVIVVRYRVLPAWLGWPWLLFVLASVVFGFVGMAGLALWLIATNIVIIRRAGIAEPARDGVARGASGIGLGR